MKGLIGIFIACAALLSFSGCFEEAGESAPEPAATIEPGPTPTPTTTQTPAPAPTPTPTPPPAPTATPAPSPTPQPTPEAKTFDLNIPRKGYFSVPFKDSGLTMGKVCELTGAAQIVKYERNKYEPREYYYCAQDANKEFGPGYAYYIQADRAATVEITGEPWEFPDSNSPFLVSEDGAYFGAPFESLEKSQVIGGCREARIRVFDVTSNKKAETISKGNAYKAYSTQSKYSCTLYRGME